MKKLLVGAVALAATIGAPVAYAADMPLKALPPPAPVYTWTGCYVGGYVGDAWGRAKSTAASSGAEYASYDLSGFVGGATVGCNYQFGTWVFGVEGDWGATNKDGQAFDDFRRGTATIAAPPALVDQTHERWIATARARLGYLVTDKWLWYVTGGGAWISAQQSVWVSGSPTHAALQTKTLSGWTIGAGTEYAVGYGWSVKSEFLYIDVQKTTFFGLGDFGNLTPPITYRGDNLQLKDYVFKVGMNYKFGWSPAVVAKY